MFEKIDDYFTGQLRPDERTAFENALRTDPELAETTAFYIAVRRVAGETAVAERPAMATDSDGLNQRQRRMTELAARPVSRAGQFSWVAAASVLLVLGLGLGWFLLNRSGASETPQQLADAYIAKNLTELPVTMSANTADSLQMGVNLFNTNKLSEAGAIFTAIYRADTANDTALKYAGIVSLRLKQYDQAIEQFHALSQRTDLMVNPGLFYETLARMERNQPNDKEAVKSLLETVISRNLAGKSDAKKLLKLQY
jgi:tetratricopeptide (TPR) repeat protein